jgi:hypothetical protein
MSIGLAPPLRLIVSTLVWASLAGGAGAAPPADEAAAPPAKPGSPSVQGFGAHNPTCLAWTDGCVLCQATTRGQSSCSIIGIACQPVAIRCTLTQPR